jgi:aminoglycoside 2'-N-acetyltransferase I
MPPLHGLVRRLIPSLRGVRGTRSSDRSGACVTVAHTAQLEPEVLDEARGLCVRAFGERFGADDWNHALGGMHALVHVDGRLVAHGAVVARVFLHAGRTLRTGYVEAVAVDPDAHRRGHGSVAMAALEDIIRRAYDLGALAASDAGAALYARRGWTRWRGPTSALTPDGILRTPDEDGGVWVLPVRANVNPDGELTCDWRADDLW